MKSKLEKEIQTLSRNLNDSNKAEYTSLKMELDNIIENEIKGSILRSLCKDYEEGEKCSKYFFSLEKFRFKQKTLSRIQLSDSTFSCDEKVILNECREFYKKLYSHNVNVKFDSYPHFFQNVNTPKLTEDQKRFCDSEISENELYETLKTFSKSKSPGLDGITAEFYLKFWLQLKVKLFKYILIHFVWEFFLKV